MATNYNKLMNNLEALKLDRIREYLDTYISMVNEGKKDMVEALYELTDFEMELRNERAMNACVKVANFPYIKTFEDFDFSYQPSISKEQILDFRNLRFMERTENILLIGTPGVGKTHLATSIGIEAAKKQKQYVLHKLQRSHTTAKKSSSRKQARNTTEILREI